MNRNNDSAGRRIGCRVKYISIQRERERTRERESREVLRAHIY